MKKVYHYCSFDTFKKIIKGQNFRLSDICCSNDSYEFNMLPNQYKNLEYYPTSDMYWVNLIKYMRQYKQTHTALAMCFSKRKDSLTMWERYGDKCAGVAIGFDADKLESYIMEFNNALMRCFDDSKEIVACFKKVNYYKVKKSWEFRSLFFEHDPLADGYLEKCALLKHAGFVEEHEWRIVMAFNKAIGLDEEKGYYKFISEIEYEKKDVKAVYLKYPKELISDIYMGPRGNIEMEDIKKILRENEICCNISCSEIPYVPQYNS